MIRLILAAALMALGAALGGADPARAQGSGLPAGTAGWCTVTWTSSACFATPEEACRRQHQEFNPGQEFFGHLDRDRWWSKQCDWWGAHYCDGTVSCYGRPYGGPAPGTVEFYCQPGHAGVAPGLCVGADEPRRQEAACHAGGGQPNPVTGNPILVLTGAKLLEASDFATADGLLALTRTYRTFATAGAEVVRRVPPGLPGGWRFGFQMELHLGDSFDYWGIASLHTPDGASYDFVRAADGSMAASYTASADALRPVLYRLSFEGPWPADLRQVTAAKTRWRVRDPQDRTWTLETFRTGPGFVVARPVEVVTASGHAWTLAYGALDELLSLTDAFGRTIGFTWTIRDPAPLGLPPTLPRVPLAIERASLPDGTSLAFAHAPLAPVPSTFPRPGRLERVERRDGAGVLLESTLYHYEDARFPAHVTGVTDARGVRSLTVAYDERGRATSSELAGGLDRTTVAYGPAAYPETTRTVVNALGKAAIYRYAANGYGRFLLTAVDGQPSPNCLGGSRAFAYDGNGFLVSETDEEGRKTTYQRDARGRPTLVTRGAP